MKRLVEQHGGVFIEHDGCVKMSVYDNILDIISNLSILIFQRIWLNK